MLYNDLRPTDDEMTFHCPSPAAIGRLLGSLYFHTELVGKQVYTKQMTLQGFSWKFSQICLGPLFYLGKINFSGNKSPTFKHHWASEDGMYG